MGQVDNHACSLPEACSVSSSAGEEQPLLPQILQQCAPIPVLFQFGDQGFEMAGEMGGIALG